MEEFTQLFGNLLNPQAAYSINGSPVALASYWCPEDFLDAASFGLQRNSGM
jgi:hypothetical protein